MKAQYIIENINFKRGKDPKDAMDIGDLVSRVLSTPEGEILKMSVKLFGSEKLIYQVERFNRKFLMLYHKLPLSYNDKYFLRKKLNELNIKLPPKYIKEDQLNYLKLLGDIFGEDWYYDDTDLVQYDRTIVHVTNDMTFEELFDKLIKSDNLKIKK